MRYMYPFMHDNKNDTEKPRQPPSTALHCPAPFDTLPYSYFIFPMSLHVLLFPFPFFFVVLVGLHWPSTRPRFCMSYRLMSTRLRPCTHPHCFHRWPGATYCQPSPNNLLYKCGWYGGVASSTPMGWMCVLACVHPHLHVYPSTILDHLNLQRHHILAECSDPHTSAHVQWPSLDQLPSLPAQTPPGMFARRKAGVA